MSVRFGLAYDFRNPEQWRQPWGEVFAKLLRQIELAEEMGFESIWLTEHHFTDDGYTPSPIPLLGAIAARTRRVEISTDILLLPLYHALHLAEDLATIDIISQGRAMLGIGMGYRDLEFEAFGRSRRQRVSLTEEGIAVLRGAWGPEPFSFDGQHYSFSELDVTPKPVRQPHPPLWLAAMSEPAARRAARLDLHLLPQRDLRASYYPWLDELAKLGRDPADYRLGVIKPWFVADAGRNDETWQRARFHERYRADVYAPWIRDGGFPELPEGDPKPIDQSYLVGPPQQLVDELSRFRDDLPATDIVGWGTPVGMDPDDVTPHLERFATEVMPHLRE
ncbi:MAG: LLM class flavin-dependent oxidoreductase [Acidobacteriota bacterium]|nr:LLM class flavin-dependent oxidoreductase [Acidobacteriota bacterium]